MPDCLGETLEQVSLPSDQEACVARGRLFLPCPVTIGAMRIFFVILLVVEVSTTMMGGAWLGVGRKHGTVLGL
jgi:hypothetical protein